MVELRITKYNPLLRDDQGRFLADDWTSVSDIGRVFNGKLLTLEECLAVENQYVFAVEQMMSVAGITELQVFGLELKGHDHLPCELHGEYCVTYDLLYDGLRVRFELVRNIIRLVLREMIWCRLTGDRDFYVHFGYDYYMYAGYDGTMADIDAIDTPLFIEPFTSPHHPCLDEDD